jgi:hypothetical protein
MIAGSVANNLGWSARQLQLIPIEKYADCRLLQLCNAQSLDAGEASFNALQSATAKGS